MAKAKRKVHHTKSKKVSLNTNIPTLHSLVVILYVLLGILFVAIYLTKFV